MSFISTVMLFSQKNKGIFSLSWAFFLCVCVFGWFSTKDAFCLVLAFHGQFVKPGCYLYYYYIAIFSLSWHKRLSVAGTPHASFRAACRTLSLIVYSSPFLYPFIFFLNRDVEERERKSLYLLRRRGQQVLTDSLGNVPWRHCSFCRFFLTRNKFQKKKSDSCFHLFSLRPVCTEFS